MHLVKQTKLELLSRTKDYNECGWKWVLATCLLC